MSILKRWRVSWNKRVPEEKQKSRPEFLELSHKLNIGNFRNISIQRAKPKPEKPAEEKKTTDESKSEKKPDNEKKPGEELNKGRTANQNQNPPKPEPKPAPKDNSSFKLPPGVNLSNSGFTKTGSTFSRLPSGISFTKPAMSSKSSTDPPPTPSTENSSPPPQSQTTSDSSSSSTGNPGQASEQAQTPPSTGSSSGEKQVDPMSLIAGINWAQVFQFTQANNANA